MKFGKLNHLDGVDFSLPANPLANKALLQNSVGKKKPTLYIGCTGWGMKEWVGHTYPNGTKTKDYLKYYCKQFNTIELNTTHYRIPDIATIEKWKANAGSDFRYCPKLVQSVSHSRDLGLGSGLLMQFCEAIERLEVYLGCCFMQLPPYFGFDHLAALEVFLNRFPSSIPLAVEVRHESWFSKAEHFEAFHELLSRKKMATVMTDVAGRRDVLHQRLSNEMAMVRFVGNDLHPSDYSRIDEWVDRLNTWFEDGLAEVYFFTHEPDNLKAPELAAYLYQKMKDNPRVITRGPQLPYQAEGQQISLF